MDIAPITSRARLLGGGLLWALCFRVLSCPFDSADPILKLRDAADVAIVKINTLGPGSCTTVGTGFFFNRAGHILTAGHVLPPDCDGSTTVDVQWSKSPRSADAVGPFKAKVLARSSLDVLVLELSDPPDEVRQFLSPSPKVKDSTTLKNSCVLLPSHYFEQNDSYSTFAEIASVSLVGDLRWALSGEGFNASRSGSPVVLPNGEVAAIFLGKPGDPNDRQGVVASRAYILPLAQIPPSEIDLEKLGQAAGKLKRFLTLESATAVRARSVRTSFGFSLLIPGNNTRPPFYFEARNGDLSRAPDSLPAAAIRALMERLNIVSQVAVIRSFTADPGFRFDATTIEYKVDSMNPKKATLPKTLCDDKRLDDCVAVSPDGTALQLRFFLYPGVDGRRSWVDAEMHITQIAR